MILDLVPVIWIDVAIFLPHGAPKGSNWESQLGYLTNFSNKLMNYFSFPTTDPFRSRRELSIKHMYGIYCSRGCKEVSEDIKMVGRPNGWPSVLSFCVRVIFVFVAPATLDPQRSYVMHLIGSLRIVF